MKYRFFGTRQSYSTTHSPAWNQVENELAKLNELPLSLKVIIPQIKNYFEISTEDETILFNVSENIIMKPYLF